MPLISWAYLCDYAFVDIVGKAYLNGMFEELNLKSLPALEPQIFVALAVIMANDESCFFNAAITSPTGRELARDNVACNGPVGGGKSIRTFKFYNTEFSETGVHHIEILVDGICVYSIPFSVSIQ